MLAREVIGEIERQWSARLGATNMHELRALLEELNALLTDPNVLTGTAGAPEKAVLLED